MGIIDARTKQYIRRPDVFADLFNFFLYDGEQLVKPENLTEMDPTELAFPSTDSGKTFPVQKYRDVLKGAVLMEDSKAAYMLILGAENQHRTHYAMPVKNLLYDALNYSSQTTILAKTHREAQDLPGSAEFLSGMRKDDRLIPVVTLVVYFGLDTWDGPLSLHQMLSPQEERILRYVPDYKISLLAPAAMSEKEIAEFRSDFRELATFIRCGKDKEAMKRLAASEERFRHMDPLTAEIANLVTGSGFK